MGLTFLMPHDSNHFTQTLCLTVRQPRVALFRARLILSAFIQVAVCSQTNLPGCPDVVVGSFRPVVVTFVIIGPPTCPLQILHSPHSECAKLNWYKGPHRYERVCVRGRWDQQWEDRQAGRQVNLAQKKNKTLELSSTYFFKFCSSRLCQLAAAVYARNVEMAPTVCTFLWPAGHEHTGCSWPVGGNQYTISTSAGLNKSSQFICKNSALKMNTPTPAWLTLVHLTHGTKHSTTLISYTHT